jgi:hypothetical protein
MIIGKHEIPEARLIPECYNDLKTIYDAVGSGDTTSLDMAKMLGYSSNTTGAFYRRFNSLVAYKLIDRAGRFRVSELGKKLVYPESENDKKLAIKEAILNIPLWKEIWDKHKKNPPAHNFWVLIKNASGIEAPKAQQHEVVVRKWYTEDVANISNDMIEEQKKYSSDSPKDKSYNKMMSFDIDDNLERITFENMSLILPKDSISDSWELLQKYMDVYLAAHKRRIQIKKTQQKQQEEEEYENALIESAESLKTNT